MRLQVTLVFVALALMCGADAKPQQQPGIVSSQDRDRGIELYQQGDVSGAIEALRKVVRENKDDAKAWHYLGLTYLLKLDKDEARKAFEKAATVRLSNLASAWPTRTARTRTSVA